MKRIVALFAVSFFGCSTDFDCSNPDFACLGGTVCDPKTKTCVRSDGGTAAGGGSSVNGGGTTATGGGTNASGGGATETGGGTTTAGGGTTLAGGGTAATGGGTTATGGGTAATGGGATGTGGGTTGTGGGTTGTGGGTTGTGGGTTGPGGGATGTGGGTAATGGGVTGTGGGATGTGGGNTASGGGVAGPAVLLVSPGAIDFGGVKVSGTSPPQTLTVSNTGASLSAVITYAFTGGFSRSSGSCGVSGSTTLAPGNSCTIDVVFSPLVTGQASTVQSIAAVGATNSPVAVTMKGKGQWELNLVTVNSGAGIFVGPMIPMNCGAACRVLFDPSPTVLVRAKGLNTYDPPSGAGSLFRGFTVNTSVSAVSTVKFDPASTGPFLPCTSYGVGNECSVVMDGNKTIEAEFVQYQGRMMFVSDGVEQVTNPGGIGYYDSICNREATLAGLNAPDGGSFIAFRANTVTPLPTKLSLPGSAMMPPYFRANGDFLAYATSASPNDPIFGSRVLVPPHLTASGRLFRQGPELDRNYDVQVMTGAFWDGTASFGSSTDACLNWTSGTGTTLGSVGTSGGGPGWYTFNTSNPGGGCMADLISGGMHFYCVQNGAKRGIQGPNLTIPSGGKRIWLSTGTVNGSAGLGGMNTLCVNDASTMSPPVSFSRALVSTITQSAAFWALSNSANYYRPDGVFIGSGSDIAKSQRLRAGIWTFADRTNFSPGSMLGINETKVWTGAAALTPGEPPRPEDKGNSNSTCNNWMSSSTMLSGATGFLLETSRRWFDGFTVNCGASLKVYCVEQ
jgi:hypothetical protein